MLICLGAANALANPRRLLRSMPPALHEVSTAVVVALSVFPQLAESLVRVRAARRLRPGAGERGLKGLRMVVIPVLEDALDRSLLLAASMDSRGYGRTGDRSRRATWATGALLVTGLAGICVGAYCLLDATTPRLLATPMLAAGMVIGMAGVVLSGRGVQRSSYRPDTWHLAELVVVASGAAAGTLMWLTSRVDPANLNPSLDPLAWPQLAVVPMVGILIGVVPAFLTPLPADAGVVDAGVVVPA
jgi:energy-coupling factor transport system permease protein